MPGKEETVPLMVKNQSGTDGDYGSVKACEAPGKKTTAEPQSTFFGSVTTLANTILGCGTLSVPFAMSTGEEGGYLVTVVVAILAAVLFSTYLLLRVCDELDRRAYKHLPYPFEIDARMQSEKSNEAKKKSDEAKKRWGKIRDSIPEIVRTHGPVSKVFRHQSTQVLSHYTHSMYDVVYVVTHAKGEAAYATANCPRQMMDTPAPVTERTQEEGDATHGAHGVVLPPKCFEGLGLIIASNAGRSVAEFTFVFGGFFILVSFLIFVGTAVSSVFPQVSSGVTIVASGVVTIPLALVKNLSSLQYVSTVAVFAIMYIVFLTAYMALFVEMNPALEEDTKAPATEEVTLLVQLTTFMYTFTLLLSSYFCHNTTLPVYERLPNRSIRNMMCCVSSALTIATFLYAVIGFSAIYAFTTVDSNLLINLNTFAQSNTEEHPNLCRAILLANIAMAACLILSFPVAMWPFRSCVLGIYLRFAEGKEHASSRDATYGQFCRVTLAVVSLIVLCAVYVPDVSTPLSIVGSVAGSLVIFVMPAWFFLRLFSKGMRPHEEDPPAPPSMALVLSVRIFLVVGVVIGVVCFGIAIFNAASAHVNTQSEGSDAM